MLGGSGRLLRPALIVGPLLGANLVLAAALARAALAPRPAVVAPSARAGAEFLPGAVPEAAAREFALRYVLHFDNYTPATVEASDAAVQRMVSARSWARAEEALRKRRPLVIEGHMSSQVLPISAHVDGLRVYVDAIRRTFLADKLSKETRVRYEVTLERQPPVEPNPFGLGVVSQEIREVEGGR